MEFLGPLGHLLYPEFIYTLSDDSIDVVETIVPKTSEILKILVQGKVISPEVMVRKETWFYSISQSHSLFTNFFSQSQSQWHVEMSSEFVTFSFLLLYESNIFCSFCIVRMRSIPTKAHT